MPAHRPAGGSTAGARLAGVVTSPPRLLAAVAAGVTLAVHVLFIQKAHIGGAPGAALLVVSMSLAAPIWIFATLGRAALALPAREAFSLPAARRLVLPGVAGVMGLLSTSGATDRVLLALVAALVALLVEAPLERAMPRHPAWRVAGAAAALALLVLPAALTHLGPPNAFERNLGGGGVPATGNVVVIGLDGIDWTIYEELAAEGALPNLGAIADAGVVQPLRTLSPTSSPFIWNSVYSGFSPEAHRRRPIAFAPHGGVLIEQAAPREGTDPLTTMAEVLSWRRIRHPFAIWDLLASAGYETAVIGSWEDLPVPTTHHVFMATHAHYQAQWDAGRHLSLGASRTTWIDPSLADTLRTLERPPADIPEAEWRRLFGEEAPIREALGASYTGETTPVAQRLARARAVYATDRLRVGIAEVLMRELPQPYFLFVYIRGIDVVQHCYLHRYRGAEPQRGEERLGDIIESYHRIADAWVGRLRALMNERDVLLVLSDHGFNVDEYQPHDYKTGFHDFAPEGILISNVRRDSVDVAGHAHVFDIAPTILSLLGLPVLASMEGRVVPAIAERGETVTDWRTLTPAVYQGGDPAKADPELLELLKSLGYL